MHCTVPIVTSRDETWTTFGLVFGGSVARFGYPEYFPYEHETLIHTCEADDGIAHFGRVRRNGQVGSSRGLDIRRNLSKPIRARGRVSSCGVIN